MLPETSLRTALLAARDTRALELGRGTLAAVPRVFREQFGERSAVIVADRNTFAAAGLLTGQLLERAGIHCEAPFIFEEPELFAEQKYLEALETALRGHAAIPVACGSGTINDLTKLAAHTVGRAYLCVPTAASMDGYTAFGASITRGGSKQTFFCPAPKAVVADLDIIRAAPEPMSAWGYADLLAKVTAGADWILADALEEEPIHPEVWNIVQGHLRQILTDPAGVRAGSPAATGGLIAGLMLSGFAMQSAQSSRPASGAEHQFSHLWDMEHHTHSGRAPSHGFKVGIGTLAIAALYEELLRFPFETLDPGRCCRAWAELPEWLERARMCLGDEELRTVAQKETSAKYRERDWILAQLKALKAIWPELRRRLQQQLLPLAELREKLMATGAPITPGGIGISRERLRQSYWKAYFIRRRFTVLDLAVRAGLLESCLDRVFRPRSAWP